MTFDNASFCYTLTSVDGQSPELKAAYKACQAAKQEETVNGCANPNNGTVKLSCHRKPLRAMDMLI
ncbi:hypothetical protein N7541_008562 [Penicillium brevicompactum]|uniref:Uncharacterized protein n=1 Tax=Penicillium brevicompactum TaxID=5074 RepID=A0A9W9R0R0_PENBR|nr:hypothetical protein N7541_008562 [Penicillium brevicompactum]